MIDAATLRDRIEMQTFVERQLNERRALQNQIKTLRNRHEGELAAFLPTSVTTKQALVIDGPDDGQTPGGTTPRKNRRRRKRQSAQPCP